MTDTIKIFTGSTGLNNKVDPVRLQFNPEVGVTELAVAYNVDIDNTGRVERRNGFTVGRDKSNFHSLFCDGGTALGVIGTSLSVVHPDLTSTAIRTVTQGARMSYAQIFNGSELEIYYCNGYERGVVRNELSYDWEVGTYVGPDTTKTYSDPPTGHLLELYNGRMYIAENNVIWYSQPFSYSAYDLARNYIQMDSRIKMIAASLDGLFISTEKGVFSLTGPNPIEFLFQKKSDYAVIEGTMAKIDGSKLLDGGVQGKLPMFMTNGGVCVGFPEGNLMNLTERKIDTPNTLFGAGIYYNDKYICTLEP